jgi:hypothetical protein
MIHIEQNQKIPENPGLRVLSPTGDYNDVDLIECAPLDGDDIAVASLQAQFIKYGGLVYRYNEPEELGKAIYEVDKNSTHDSALLYAEDEARRQKRKAGTLVPENQVPADEAVSASQKAKAAVLDEESLSADGADTTATTTATTTPKTTATTTPSTATTTATTSQNNTATSTAATSTVPTPNTTATTTSSTATTTATTTPTVNTGDTASTTPVYDFGTSTTTPETGTSTTTATTTGSTASSTPEFDFGTSTTTPIVTTDQSTTTPQVEIINAAATTTEALIEPAATSTDGVIDDTIQSLGAKNPVIAFAKKRIGRKLGL